MGRKIDGCPTNYLYVCVCVCESVWKREREREVLSSLKINVS